MNPRPHRHPSRRKQQGGFTLAEIIIAVMIISLVAGFAVPLYANYQESTRLGQAEQFYLQEVPKAAAACLLAKSTVANCLAAPLQAKGLQPNSPWGDAYTVAASGVTSLQFTMPLTSSYTPDETGADLATKLGAHGHITASYAAATDTLTVTVRVR